MFAPRVAKPSTKSAKPERMTALRQRRSQSAVEHLHLLQRSFGNQAMLRLLAQRASVNRNEPCTQEEKEADTAHITVPKAASSWDFGQIPLFSSGHAEPFQVSPVVQASRHTIQAKLAIGRVDDPLEHEADRVADMVMRIPEPQLQRTCACGGMCPKCQSDQPEPENERLQTKRADASDSGRSSAPPIVQEVLNSPGHPLDSATRAFMEPRFGHSFGHVRVHTDEKAEDSADALGALAYTVGRDVVFGAGQYTISSNGGRKLIAHELTHVVQQGFTTQSVLQKDDKKKDDEKKKKAHTNPGLVFNEIKRRNPDLAGLITPQSIDFTSPKEPPAVKGGPMKDGENHIWKVFVLAAQGFRSSATNVDGEMRTRVKGGAQVIHTINITWALPLAPDPEFVKQAASADEAFTMTAAEPLFHELLHARIIMERDPHWTSQHTQVFQGFTDLMNIANSSAVDKERQALKQEIGTIARGGGKAKDAAAIAAEQDKYFEFLVHEKYDADTEGKAFGRSFTNAVIASKYSDVVALRLGLGDRVFQTLKVHLAAAAKNLFDELDNAASPHTPGTPTSSPPATKQQPQ
jgi:hypothetical protein